MEIFEKSIALNHFLDGYRTNSNGIKIGFVPTMGALHEGHFTLMQEAKEQCDYVVVSIFVNPTQFNNQEDFQKYPRKIEGDIKKLENLNVDVLFLPDEGEIYPEGKENLEHYDLGDLENIGEGAFRPGHFQGVCQVLSRLMSVVRPDKMMMGQKDFQQVLVTKKLVEILGYNVEIVMVPTCREKDGLAMSSRNLRLSPEGRTIAPNLYKNLRYIQEHLKNNALNELIESAKRNLAEKSFRVEYLYLADITSLRPIDSPESGNSYVLLCAAWLEGIRLIDNLLVNAE